MECPECESTDIEYTADSCHCLSCDVYFVYTSIKSDILRTKGK